MIEVDAQSGLELYEQTSAAIDEIVPVDEGWTRLNYSPFQGIRADLSSEQGEMVLAWKDFGINRNVLIQIGNAAPVEILPSGQEKTGTNLENASNAMTLATTTTSFRRLGT
ncbi:MAG TPA: hypothetical protein VLE91_02500 [Candidatus Saccharimonadales bacterium]|nr:hypothetical protein [Candidatus Saccharimonadales bacterium]